ATRSGAPDFLVGPHRLALPGNPMNRRQSIEAVQLSVQARSREVHGPNDVVGLLLGEQPGVGGRLQKFRDGGKDLHQQALPISLLGLNRALHRKPDKLAFAVSAPSGGGFQSRMDFRTQLQQGDGGGRMSFGWSHFNPLTWYISYYMIPDKPPGIWAQK